MGNAEDIITLRSKGRMQGSGVTGRSATGNYCNAVPDSKSYDSNPWMSQDWSADGILCKKCRGATNYPQRVGSLHTMEMNGARYVSGHPDMQRAQKNSTDLS